MSYLLESVEKSRAAQAAMWKDHRSNRSDAEYKEVEKEFYHIALKISRAVREEQLGEFSFLAGELTQELDRWDRERAGYTQGNTVDDYWSMLQDELHEYDEKPWDVKEIADVVIFANRIACHPEASFEQKVAAVGYQLMFTRILIDHHADKGTPKDIVWKAIRKNEEHYPPVFYSNSDVVEVGGKFMKRIRSNFPGNQLPLQEEWYRGYAGKPVIGVNGRVWFNEEGVKEMTDHFAYLYSTDGNQDEERLVIGDGGSKQQGVIYERVRQPAAD